MLTVRLLGKMEVARGAEGVMLPPSKKTRALLAYLIMTGRPHRRERLCELLWDVPDDPRGALRWSLSKLRPLLDEPEHLRILADREAVALDMAGAHVDLLAVRDHLRGDIAAAPTERLRDLAATFRGEFLEGLSLPDHHRFQAWCAAEREDARRLQATILRALVKRLAEQAEEALPFAHRLVHTEPFDEPARAMLVRLLIAADRRQEAQEAYETSRRILAEAGTARGELHAAWHELRQRPVPAPEGSSGPPATVRTPLPCLRRPAIAVLPLRAASLDPVDVILANAVTEDLVTALSRERNLAVASGGLNLDWNERPANLGTLARQLDIQYLLEGSIRRGRDRLLVLVRLVDAASGRDLWAERCDQRLDDRPTVDEQIAYRVVAAVRGEIETAEARKALGSALHERDARAWYHLGLRETYRFAMPGLVAAKEHFERAVSLDPDFASAYARLAYVHIQSYWYGPRGERDVALERASAVARQAIALDSKEARGHFAMGRIYALRRQFDWAMPEFETAIRLNPSFAQAHFGLGQAYWYAGRPDEAARLLQTAIELDPYDPHLWTFFHDQADAYYALGRLKEAEQSARAAARLPNSTHWALATLASVLGAAGKREEAAEAIRQLLSRKPEYSPSFAEDEFAHLANKPFVAGYVEGLKAAGLTT